MTIPLLNVDRAWQLVIAIGAAELGCLVRILYKDVALPWRRLYAEVNVAGVIGYVFLAVANHFGLSADKLGAVCIVAGWSGARVFDFLEAYLDKQAGK